MCQLQLNPISKGKSEVFSDAAVDAGKSNPGNRDSEQEEGIHE